MRSRSMPSPAARDASQLTAARHWRTSSSMSTPGTSAYSTMAAAAPAGSNPSAT